MWNLYNRVTLHVCGSYQAPYEVLHMEANIEYSGTPLKGHSEIRTPLY